MRSRQPREVQAAVVGECDSTLRELLRDVLGNLGVALGDSQGIRSPDVVLALVNGDDLADVIAAARTMAGRPPVVALLAMSDEHLAARSIAAGAIACYSLDTPLDRLHAILRASIGDRLAEARRFCE